MNSSEVEHVDADIRRKVDEIMHRRVALEARELEPDENRERGEAEHDERREDIEHPHPAVQQVDGMRGASYCRPVNSWMAWPMARSAAANSWNQITNLYHFIPS